MYYFMENPIDSVITTCDHPALCLQCGTLVTQCPICRNPFNQQYIVKFLFTSSSRTFHIRLHENAMRNK